MSEIDLTYRASRAMELLEDPIFAEAFDAIERGTIEEMLQPNIPDDLRRQKADRVNAIRAVRQQFENIVREGNPPSGQAIKPP